MSFDKDKKRRTPDGQEFLQPIIKPNYEKRKDTKHGFEPSIAPYGEVYDANINIISIKSIELIEIICNFLCLAFY